MRQSELKVEDTELLDADMFNIGDKLGLKKKVECFTVATQ